MPNNGTTIKSVEDAINLTMKKYNNSEEERIKFYEQLEMGNYNVITSEQGARAFVKQFYENLQRQATNPAKESQTYEPFTNFSTLSRTFDQLLNAANIKKDDVNSFALLYQRMMGYFQNPDHTAAIENLLIMAATTYNEQYSNRGPARQYDFSTMDMTRDEACEITRIFGNMEHQRGQVTNALKVNENYKKILISNLISYVYYENDYHKSLETSVKEAQHK